MKITSPLVATVLILGCSTKFMLPDYSRHPDPLPDLRIKRIEYHPTQKQQVFRSPSGTAITLAKLSYEFTLIIENVGNKTLDQPFYVSISGSLTDYQEHLYSRHLRLNDEGQHLEPGHEVPFIVVVDLDFPPSRQTMSHYPIRFYINTEGPANSTGFPTLFIPERSYQNNTYELQVRLR
jgi:hypothetical protein